MPFHLGCILHPYRPAPLTMTFRGLTVSTANQTSYTASAIPIGVATATRHVIAAIGARSSTNGGWGGPICTIGGVQATQIARDTGTVGFHTGLFMLNIPSSTTVDIFAGFGNSQLGCAFAVWTLTGRSLSVIDGASSSSSGTFNRTTADGGAGFGIMVVAQASGNGIGLTGVDTVEFNQAIDGSDVTYTIGGSVATNGATWTSTWNSNGTSCRVATGTVG